MQEREVQIFRVDRCFNSYGVRPFVLVTSAEDHSSYDAVVRAEYLIVHAKGQTYQKLDALMRSIPKLSKEASACEYMERAAIDDAFDLLSADIDGGGEAISDKCVVPATLSDLLLARQREAIAAPNPSPDFLYKLSEVLSELGGVKVFKRK